jgi:hypothetical protein
MRKRGSIVVLTLVAVIGLGTSDLLTFARSTCRVHHYFESLKTTKATMTALERLLISVVLANTHAHENGKS